MATQESDVVVVGSGAAGLTAAFCAAKAGLRVTVLESTEFFGGTTAISGGGVWVPANRHQSKLGIRDGQSDADTYLRATLAEFYDAAKAAAFLSSAPPMLEFMEDNSEVQLIGTSIPDYEPSAPGWNQGRCLLTADYDGRKLGPLFPKLRRPIPEMGVFGSMQVSPGDAAVMTHWSRSPQAFKLTARRLLAYAADRLQGRPGSVLANGNALAGRLLKSVSEAGVTLLSQRRAQSLSTNSGAVTGVVASHLGREEVFVARRGVVLASGGFGANAQLRRKFLPQADAGWSLQPEGSQGDGIAMGLALGGTLNESNASNGIWVQASACRRADGSLAKYPSFFDRSRPGSIMVDARDGRRFVDEGLHYQHIGETTREKGVTKIWQISDRIAVRQHGLGMVKPGLFPIGPWLKKGYIIEAESIGLLAEKIGVNPAVLEQTVAKFNQYADAGVDPEFNRGGTYFSAFMGDPTNTPNPSMRALRAPPFYALELRPSDLSTVAGLDTNERAQVLSKSGAPIPGLYAAGLDSNSMMRGRYPSGGSSIGAAMTFGFIAARELAAR